MTPLLIFKDPNLSSCPNWQSQTFILKCMETGTAKTRFGKDFFRGGYIGQNWDEQF